MSARRAWGWIALVFFLILIAGFLLMPVLGAAPKDKAMAACVERLRPALPPLDLASSPAASEDERAYRAYYRLDCPGARQRLGALEVAGHRIAVQVCEPADCRGTVVLAHGYYDHMGVWRHLLAALVADGWRVVCYDQPGHGLSDGEPAAIADFQTYVEVLDGIADFAAERFPGGLHVVAHSMGAGVAADWLLQEKGDAAGRVVLLAPLFHSSAWGVSRFGHTVAGQWFRAMPRKYRRNSGDADYLAFVRADPLQYDTLPASWVGALGGWNRQIAARPPSQCAVLVLQGENDTTVDWGYNLPLLERLFPRAEARRIPGARHQLLNESPPLREAVVREILETLAAP